jgi:hypothetical protein
MDYGKLFEGVWQFTLVYCVTNLPTICKEVKKKGNEMREGRAERRAERAKRRAERAFVSSAATEQDDSKYWYPLDGLWLVQWESGMIADIVVKQNGFTVGQHRYTLDLSGNRPTFHWPSHNVVQTAVEGIDLGAQPQGPPVGSQVVWKTSENERITWTRLTDG